MSKMKTKELIICIVTFIVLVLSIITNVFAVTNIEATLGGNSTGNNVQQIQERGNNTNNNAFNNTSNAVNNTNNSNNTRNVANNTKMPNTGVDYSILFIVAVCGISAIYAYKKISDYKNF